MVRRVISLFLALALTGTSGFAFVYLLFFAKGFKVWMPVTAGMLLLVGLYWLWADFINAEPKPDR
jgi:hypothetical protein